jgi:hypothetical protein
MNQIEFATAEVPPQVRQAKPAHVEDMPEEIAPIAEKISSGQGFLRVVAYPWGVEFDFCDGEGRE